MATKIIDRSVDCRPGMYTVEVDGYCLVHSICCGSNGYPTIYIRQDDSNMRTIIHALLVETDGELPSPPDAYGWHPMGTIRSTVDVLPYTLHCFCSSNTIRDVD